MEKIKYNKPTTKCIDMKPSRLLNAGSPGQEDGAKEDNGFMDETEQ